MSLHTEAYPGNNDLTNPHSHVSDFSGLDNPKDLVPAYLASILDLTPLLDHSQEIALAQTIEVGMSAVTLLENGDSGSEKNCSKLLKQKVEGESARDYLAIANLKLVVSIAKKHMDKGVLLIDLISSGNVGLMEAVEGYDWRIGTKFSTFATPKIRKGVKEQLALMSGTIHVRKQTRADIAKIKEFSDSCREMKGEYPTEEEISRKLGMSTRVVERRGQQRLLYSQESLDINGWTPQLSDRYHTRNDDVFDRGFYIKFLRSHIRGVLASFDERTQKMFIRDSAAFMGEHIRTRKEIGRDNGIGPERVRQLLKAVYDEIPLPAHSIV